MKKIFSSIVFFSLLLLVLQACTEAKTEELPEEVEKKPKIVSVKLGKVEKVQRAAPIQASGLLGTKEQTKLSFKIGGIISSLNADEGDFVKKGQLLATLEMTEIEAQVAQAKSSLAKSERDLARVKKLYADTVATLEQVQDVTTGLEVAAASLKIAEFNRKYAQIIAPESGKVLRRLAEPQELTGPGNPIFVIATAGDAKVMRVGLADKDIVKIRVGDKATIDFDAYPGETFRATVREIPELPDPQTGTYPVELSIQQRGKVFKTGFFGKVKIQPSTKMTYYKVPIDALVEANKAVAYVFVPDAGRAKKVAVQPFEIGDGFFTVFSKQIQLNEVITDGAAYLSDGESIRIMNEE